MGNHDINRHIGYESFNDLLIAEKNDISCFDNCVLIKKKCDGKSAIINLLVKMFALKKLPFKCPIEFYNCTNNVAFKNKLTSGFYVNQKLNNGMSILKPTNGKKCSHGGILDATSNISPKGGINKDSGFMILSPHAHLHTIAAELAIRHTEMFFNEIRASIGDEEFSKFLKIKKDKITFWDSINNYVQLCRGSRLSH